MKKMYIIIVILAIIFTCMVIRRKGLQKNKENNVTIEEINLIEKYITKIYMWKEVTDEALPKFQEINQADEKWIWQVVKRNLQEEKLSYEQIEEKAKELFGGNLQKQFPKEGVQGIIELNSENLYNASSTIIDEKEDKFLLHEIKKNNNEYVVELVEYIEDHAEGNLLEDETKEYNIVLRNLKEEGIEKVRSSTSEMEIKELVKNNIERYTKKKVILHKNNDGEITVVKVE